MSKYQALPLNSFGRGLNLRSKPDAVDPAEGIDLLNVIFTDRGAIVQRSGSDLLTSAPLTNRVDSLEPFYKTDTTKQLLAGCGTRLEAIEIPGGGVKASATGLTNAPWDFARFGKPNAEVAYAGNGTDTLRKWDGAAWTAPTATVNGEAGKAMPKAGSICVQPADNRLVCSGFSTTTGGPNGLESSPSHVYFSEAGDPEAFEGTGYIQFTPGDGERVMAVIAWREFVFVFKETKFFVVTNTAVTGEGNPEFDYRPVETGIGLAARKAVCVHPSGVYFMGRHGVYRTTGEEPEEVSDLIGPIWTGNVSPFYQGGTLDQGSIANCAMAVHEDQIYLSYPTAEANSRTLIFDPQFNWWSLLDFGAAALASVRIGNAPELVFGYASGSKDIARHSLAFTNDDGVAISSRWRSGWTDHGNPDVKKIRGSKVWGSGVVSMGLDDNFNVQTGELETLDMTGSTGSTFGGEGEFGGAGFFGDLAAALVGAERRIAARGTTFSMHFTNSTLDQPWEVHRVEQLLPKVRDPARIAA